MAIDYDTSALPQGDLAWSRFLAAVEASSATDETEWLEHKAGVDDPTSKAGSVTIAKAIVGFANRDPQRASTWIGGHALILLGLEPGSVKGTAQIDPARLHDAIERYLAPPAPGWYSTEHTYGGKRVIVITVFPPQPGDPIAMIGRATEGYRDGQIYVRRPGKSDQANSIDVRRLEARRNAGPAASLDVSVEVAEGTIPWLVYWDDWMDRWIDRERTRLLAPLVAEQKKAAQPERPEKTPALRELLNSTIPRTPQIDVASYLFKSHEETRTPEQYEAEVQEYLGEARRGLGGVLGHLREYYAGEVTFEVRNHTKKNFLGLKVALHVEGAVDGFERPDRSLLLDGWTPKAPRMWGPWREDPLSLDHIIMPPIDPVLFSRPPYLGPTIVNGGSATVTFQPVDLRPGESCTLPAAYLLAATRFSDTTRCTWTATATNVDAIAEGEFTVELEDAPRDVSQHLADVL